MLFISCCWPNTDRPLPFLAVLLDHTAGFSVLDRGQRLAKECEQKWHGLLLNQHLMPLGDCWESLLFSIRTATRNSQESDCSVNLEWLWWARPLCQPTANMAWWMRTSLVLRAPPKCWAHLLLKHACTYFDRYMPLLRWGTLWVGKRKRAVSRGRQRSSRKAQQVGQEIKLRS